MAASLIKAAANGKCNYPTEPRLMCSKYDFLSLPQEPGPTSSDLAKGSAVVISLVHDMAECIVGDITPKDGVADADKHQMEMKAMKQLVSLVADENGHIFYEAFNRSVMIDIDSFGVVQNFHHQV